MNKKLVLFIGMFSLFFIFGFKVQKNFLNQTNIIEKVKTEEVKSEEKIVSNEIDNLEIPKKEVAKATQKEEKNSDYVQKEIDLRELSSVERKKAFVDMLLPAITAFDPTFTPVGTDDIDNITASPSGGCITFIWYLTASIS